jgi:hypothetical protein
MPGAHRLQTSACHAGFVHLRACLAASLPFLLLAGGCGGGGGSKQAPAATAPRPQAPARNPLALPAGVPRTATGPAAAVATRTIRNWAQALRAGDIEGAAALWALPAKIQNATPVITLRTRADVLIFNDSLTCGAVLTATGAAGGGYTIATFRLTERRGGHGQCGSGVGQRAQTAVQVRRGHIVSWYRLPETKPAPVV